MSQDSHPRKSVLRNERKLESNHTVKFFKGTWHHIKFLGKNESIARRYSKSVNLTNTVRALPDLRKGHRTKPTKKDAPTEWHGTWRKLSTSSKIRIIEARATPPPTSKSPEERDFAVDSRASMYMPSKKGIELRRAGDSAEIQNTHNFGNGQWGGANKRRSTRICLRS